MAELAAKAGGAKKGAPEQDVPRFGRIKANLKVM